MQYKDSDADSNACSGWSIDSDLSQVGQVATSVRSLVENINFVDASPNGVELALVELMNNCIEHAYQSKAGHELKVEYLLLEDELRLTTIDTGNEIPPEVQQQINSSEIAMQELPTDIMMLPESGWGLSLIKSLCQKLRYARVGDTNVFTLCFSHASGSDAR